MKSTFNVYTAGPAGRQHRVAHLTGTARDWKAKAHEFLTKYPGAERVLVRDALGGLRAEFTRDRDHLTPEGR